MPSFDSTKKGFENLSASNYNEWEENMSALLKTRREYLITIGQDPEPEFVDADHPTYQERKDWKDWKETKVSAAGTIYLCLDESQKAHVKKCLDDPEQMWDTLKAIHQQRKPATRFVAYDSFFNLKKETDEALPDLVSRGSQIMSRIRALRPSHFGLQQLEEELLVMALIRALPQPEYGNFVTSLFLLSDKLTLEGLSTAFHNEENNQKLRAGDPSISVALKATTSPSSANLTSAGTKSTCGWCLREGHSEDECETKKFSLKRDQERAAERMASKRRQKGTGKREAANSADIKEETASQASTDPSSPAMSHWNTDTGASRHMTPHRHWFNVYSPHIVPIRLADNTVIYSEGIGTVVLEPEVEGEKSTVVELLDTLHVPALRNNLLSPYHLTREKGFKISITGSDVTFCQDDKLVMGMKREPGPPTDPICPPCLAGKQHHHNIPRGPSKRRTQLLELVYSDLKGPMPVATLEGYRYWVTFICSTSDIWGVSLLKHKSDAFAAFKQFKVHAENVHPGLKIVEFQEDKGGEYMGKEFTDFCANHGITRRHTEPDEPYQNGVAERANCMITEAATAMLNESHLPPSFWGLAV
ncbi:uncharacterized protein ARMOST_18445 [Armillaria ostoyae]|uniref:Integrase catalytic domain-containing protein n=1 Tax=Armillaria ostoyae TaxID=47428 RepID=A0A284S1T9_ARMOS|nr:uncharacterized protein ARMOST_18445 [Armillaria ostoyae]